MDLTLESGTPAHVVPTQGADRGLVVIPDIWGLRGLFNQMCHDLAARTGWSVGAFDPFGGMELPPADDPDGFPARSAALRDLDDDRVLGDAAAVADATGCDGVGLIGFCMGGMYALKGAAAGRFDRVVSFYGMIEVPSDWAGTGQGQPLDALARSSGCDVMSVVGTADEWTPPDKVDALEAAGATVLRYVGAEHGFVHDPSRPAHRPDDATDAWDKALAFLDGLGA
ncbi:MAG: dienelactone hydrolase family protein [Microthrixaceae bacterium]